MSSLPQPLGQPWLLFALGALSPRYDCIKIDAHERESINVAMKISLPLSASGASFVKLGSYLLGKQFFSMTQSSAESAAN